MRRYGIRRFTALAVLATLCGAAGCTQYHYYGNGGPCDMPPGARPVVIQSPPAGDVCEVPPRSGTTIVNNSPSGGSQVLVSQPQGVRNADAAGSRFAWRRSDPESMATTRVEGGIDESAVR